MTINGQLWHEIFVGDREYFIGDHFLYSHDLTV